MKNYQIAKKRLRYIVPFQYDRTNHSFEEICRRVDHQEDNTSLQYGDFCFDEISIRNRGLPNQKIMRRNRTCEWKRKTLKQGEQDVYSYIIDEFSDDHKIEAETELETSGCFWIYSIRGQSDFKMEFKFTIDKTKFRLNNQFSYENVKNDEISNLISLRVAQVGLYIFRSGIGLLYYEIEDPSDSFQTSDSLIQFQNTIKELNQNQSIHCWIHGGRISGDDIEECWIPFLLGNWISERLARLAFLGVSYQASRKNAYAKMLAPVVYPELPVNAGKEKLESASCLPKFCPDKAILFSYLVFDRGTNWTIGEDETHISYYLTNGYDKKYEPGLQIRESMRMPFSNVVWMATKEGCGYFAWVDKNNGSNRNFFVGNMSSKIMNDYFLLYIRVLYQSFSLMEYSRFLSKILPNHTERYLRISRETESLSDDISTISTEVSLFLVKSLATSVSHIQHQSDYYVYLCEQLKIEEDVKSVTTGLSALHDLQRETLLKKERLEVKKERLEAEERSKNEKKADSILQLALGCVTLLTLISAVSDGYTFIAGFMYGPLSSIRFYLFLAVAFLCAVISIVGIIALFNALFKSGSISKLKKSNNESEKLMVQDERTSDSEQIK